LQTLGKELNIQFLSSTKSSVSTASVITDFKEITKMGLSISVVFSSIAGYLLGSETISFVTLFLLAMGGYFMVGASNAYNQIIERDLDALMDRTKNRPIPAGRMSVNTAFAIASIFTILGVITLYIINITNIDERIGYSLFIPYFLIHF
jgi:protoheme IX farnesyltransferase